MPIGDPKSQTIASKKYQDKIGIISKSYKLKRELVEDFADACEEAGISQAGQLTNMMKTFVSKEEAEKEYIQVKKELSDRLLEVDIVINELKGISSEMGSEKATDKIEECINKLFHIKNETLKCNNLLYDIYNRIYQEAKE